MARLTSILLSFSSSPVNSFLRYGNAFKRTIRRDLKGLRLLIRTQLAISKLKWSNSTVSSAFQEVAAKNREKTALVHLGQTWTFHELDSFSNKVANAFRAAGFKPGDEVALLMESKPEFVGIWMGLSKAGCVTALLNTYLKSQNLLHSLSVIKAKALIYDAQFQPEVENLLSIMPRDYEVQFFSFGENREPLEKRVKSLKPILQSACDLPVDYKGNFTDRLLYIYTSGTTGLPKAAIITNARFFVFATGIHLVTEMLPDDVIYTPLPLYHFAGGVLGVSQCLMHGNSLVLRHKFSASHYWEDCVKNNCTVAQYIGEICRYLLAQPPDENEKKHKIRCIYGNGFRPQLWPHFRSRFGISKIAEFYGATEGNASIINIDNHDGACGFLSVLFPSWLLSKIYPISLIKVDQETGDPIRNEKGLCIKCSPREIGQFVGLIKNENPIKRFDGYSDKEKTKRKIIRDVFKHGDTYYASGDLLEMDELGYVYFRDRTGDNFRWKGENVSTGEIEAAISECTNLTDCAAYGVKVNGYEGRAGMVAIADPERKLEVNKMLQDLKTRLPPYAIPVFIRIVDKIDVTSTYKIPKNVLQKQGYDINLVQDPIYVLDCKNQCYQKVDQEMYKKLNDGEASL